AVGFCMRLNCRPLSISNFAPTRRTKYLRHSLCTFFRFVPFAGRGSAGLGGGGIGSLNGPATNLFLPSGQFEFGKNLMSNALPTTLGAAAPGKSSFAFLNLFMLTIKNPLRMNTSTFFHQLR